MKLFKINTLIKIITIFSFGLVTRHLVNYSFDINVFSDYTNIISISYYFLLSFIIVYISEFIDSLSILSPSSSGKALFALTQNSKQGCYSNTSLITVPSNKGFDTGSLNSNPMNVQAYYAESSRDRATQKVSTSAFGSNKALPTVPKPVHPLFRDARRAFNPELNTQRTESIRHSNNSMHFKTVKTVDGRLLLIPVNKEGTTFQPKVPLPSRSAGNYKACDYSQFSQYPSIGGPRINPDKLNHSDNITASFNEKDKLASRTNKVNISMICNVDNTSVNTVESSDTKDYVLGLQRRITDNYLDNVGKTGNTKEVIVKDKKNKARVFFNFIDTKAEYLDSVAVEYINRFRQKVIWKLWESKDNKYSTYKDFLKEWNNDTRIHKEFTRRIKDNLSAKVGNVFNSNSTLDNKLENKKNKFIKQDEK